MKQITLGLMLISLQAMAEGMPKNESSKDLLDGNVEIINIKQIEKSGLNNGASKLEIWSGSYWPLFQGGMSARYRDNYFQNLVKKDEQYDAFKEGFSKHPLYSYSGRLDSLSPTEKYDLLIGDSKMSLTKFAWENAQKESGLGKVPIWRGFCDGWAAAAQKLPRPTKSVVLETPAGEKITFFPEDIKALGSLMYSRSQEDVVFLGKRCATFGRLTGGCNETNPATFHRALVNKVGVMGQSFVADVSPGKEVWNYPIKSYKISYYNVFTDEDGNFEASVENFKQNKSSFSKHFSRHDKTAWIIGVRAEVHYADMRPAHLLSIDSVANDKTLIKEYFYDLELDANYNIVGGESVSKNLPDFVWAPNELYPLSEVEREWTIKSPSDLIRAAQIAAKSGQPLTMIVKKLFDSAK